jgi:hypothetical protein
MDIGYARASCADVGGMPMAFYMRRVYFIAIF